MCAAGNIADSHGIPDLKGSKFCIVAEGELKLIVLMCHTCLAWQWVSHLTKVTGAGMKLTVLMWLWHPWLDRE
jgi:hypothetical protein